MDSNWLMFIFALAAIVAATFPIISEFTKYNPIDYLFNTASSELLRTFKWMKYFNYNGEQILLFVTRMDQLKFAQKIDGRLEKFMGAKSRGYSKARAIWKVEDHRWESEFLDFNKCLKDEFIISLDSDRPPK